MTKGTLYLIPTVISEEGNLDVIPAQLRDALPSIQHFLVEEPRTARRFLSSLKIFASIESLQFSILNKNTKPDELPEYFAPIFNGKNIGVLSESGCPGVADPGALAVNYAHRFGIRVKPLVGPSSIFLALMASGLNGQQFRFNGYLPIDSKEAAAAIRELERTSRSGKQTEIFIETPYRNNSVFQNLVKNLKFDTELCVAMDITGVNEFIESKTVEKWRSQTVELPKKPAIFLFLANQ
jgi:16S rRNA (cytidine1402-2'-O)-methyltransferase